MAILKTLSISLPNYTLRDWSLITGRWGRGGATKLEVGGGGGTSEVLPLRNGEGGGGGQTFSHAEGRKGGGVRQNKFWCIFSAKA